MSAAAERAMIAAPVVLVSVIFIASLVSVVSTVIVVEGRVLIPSSIAERTWVWVRTASHDRGESMVGPRAVSVTLGGDTQRITTDDDGFGLVSFAKVRPDRAADPTTRERDRGFAALAIRDDESAVALFEGQVNVVQPPETLGRVAAIPLSAAPGKTHFTMGIATGRLVTNVPTRVVLWSEPTLDPATVLVVDDLAGVSVQDARICKDGRIELLATAQFQTVSLRVVAKTKDDKELGTAFIAPPVAMGAIEVQMPVVLPPKTERTLATRIPSSRRFAYAVLRDATGVIFARGVGRDEPLALPALEAGHYALTTTPDLGAENQARITYPLVVGPSKGTCDTAFDRAPPDANAEDVEAAVGAHDVMVRGSSEGKAGMNRRAIRRGVVWSAFGVALLVELVGLAALTRKPATPLVAGERPRARVLPAAALVVAFGLVAAYIAWRF